VTDQKHSTTESSSTRRRNAGGHAEVLTGLGEAAKFGNPLEQLHRAKTVHSIVLNSRILIGIILNDRRRQKV